MNFSERLGQVMHEVWGYDVVGNLGKDGYLEFFPTDTVSEPEVVHCKEGLFAYYRYERGDIGTPVFRSSSLHVMEHCLVQNYGNPIRKKLGYLPLSLYGFVSAREGWILARRDLRLRHDYWGVQKNGSAYYPCQTHDQYLLAALSYVVEYSPLEVLECYLRPDVGPLLSQWVDLEWTPEEDE